MAIFARALLVGCLFALFVRCYLLQLYKVPSDSMAPGLLPGDHVAVDRFSLSREPRRFEILVFEGPGGRRLIKRLLGLPGERVEVENHRLTVDGRPLEEDAAYLLAPGPGRPAEPGVPASFGPLRLGAGEYLLLGDQRGVSIDSRVFGPVERRQIVGRAFLIYWSVPGDPPAAEGPSFDKIAAPARSRWLTVRWNRCLRPLR
jgi:signal peptidase I